MSDKEKIWTVIPAAGIGTRMGAEIPKQYMKIQDKCILEYTLERFCFTPRIDGVVVALAENDPFWPTLSISSHEKLMYTTGGAERCHSVLNGLRRLEEVAAGSDWVLVHDAARPCLTGSDIHQLIDTLKDDEVGGILALSSHDTLKNVAGLNIIKTIDRSRIWRALTPQMFRYEELKRALEEAADKGSVVTDEASALELKGLQPKIVEGRPDNIKITRPEDLPLANFYLEQQC
jgi:2-C-methyl-D-erythritol 4-phosphate cytidylyltransferase